MHGLPRVEDAGCLAEQLQLVAAHAVIPGYEVDIPPGRRGVELGSLATLLASIPRYCRRTASGAR